MVYVAPETVQTEPAPAVKVTVKPELAVAPTVKVSPDFEVAGAGVTIVIV
jgi:hypothetical protein